MISIKAIGTVVEDNEQFITALAGKPVVIPLGYTMERAVWEDVASGSQTSAPKKKSTTHVVLAYKDETAKMETADASTPRFCATVEQAEAGEPPRITVVRSDDPEKKRYSSAKSHTTAWREALQEATTDFPEKSIGDVKGAHGLRLMGLHLVEVISEIRALPGGEAAFAKAEAMLATRKAEATVVDEASSVQSTPAVVVTGSKPGGKRSKAAKVTTDTAPVAAATASVGDGTTPAKTRRSRKAEPASATASAAKPVTVVVCPDCGLAGTPFCAATGKPHETAPCSKCGLTSAFCPVTGEAHSGAIQRENRARGEVHLPGGTRRRGSKKASADEAGATADAAVTVEGTPAKKTRRKRGAEGEQEGVQEGSGASEGTKKRRTRSAKGAVGGEAATIATTEGTTPADGMRQTTLPTETVEPSLFDLIAKDPETYLYPTLRPPLGLTDQRRALHAMEHKWQEKGTEPVLPTSAHALQIPLVPAKRRQAAAPAAGQGRKKAKTEQVSHTTKAETEEEAEEDGEDAKEVDEKGGAAAAQASRDATTDTLTMVHPLEVQDVMNSANGKRLTKFLWQYTSERSKFDLLRAQNAAAGSGKPHGSGADKAKVDEDASVPVEPVKTEEAEAVNDDTSTQVMSDRQATGSSADVEMAAAQILQGTSEVTLPRVASV